MRTFCVVLALGAMASVLLTSCGDSDSETGADGLRTDVSKEQAERRTLSPSMPMTKQLAITFPVPKAEPDAPPGTAAGIKAGREACKGKTPIQVREEFIDEADDLLEDQEEVVEQLPKYEKGAGESPNFAAGQIAAGVYEATLAEKLKRGGFRGCVYELALQLRHELSKKGKGGGQ